MESEESALKKDELVQNLVDHFGDWFQKEDCENRAGGSGRMKDLKHLIYFENLLQEVNNELVRQAKEEGKLALGYTCYFMVRKDKGMTPRVRRTEKKLPPGSGGSFLWKDRCRPPEYMVPRADSPDKPRKLPVQRPARASLYPLTAPSVTPRMKYFWNAMKMMTTGSAAKQPPAMARP